MNINSKLIPTEDRILVKVDDVESKTIGGIVLPEIAQEKSQIGSIVAVGPGNKENPMTRKVGEKVLYSQYGGTSIKLKGENHLILRCSDVLAVL